MSSSNVQFIDNSTAWLAAQTNLLMGGLERMGVSGKNIALITTPMSEGGGNLRNSGRVDRKDKTVIVSFGNEQVDYAGAQEAGHRGDVYFKHYTTPGTGPHFLKNGMGAAVRKGIKAYI